MNADHCSWETQSLAGWDIVAGKSLFTGNQLFGKVLSALGRIDKKVTVNVCEGDADDVLGPHIQ